MPTQTCMPCWLGLCSESLVCDGQVYTSSDWQIPCQCPCPKKENTMPETTHPPKRRSPAVRVSHLRLVTLSQLEDEQP